MLQSAVKVVHFASRVVTFRAGFRVDTITFIYKRVFEELKKENSLKHERVINTTTLKES